MSYANQYSGLYNNRPLHQIADKPGLPRAILKTLSGEMTGLELAEKLNKRVGPVNWQLKRLQQKGLIESVERDGTVYWRAYSE